MEFQTTQLHKLIDRLQHGDAEARNELVRSVCSSLERLAHKMLQRYPRVQRWEETGDVLQNALLRLLRALQDVKPPSMRDFFGLAAEQLRRELLDLARYYRSAKGALAGNGDGVRHFDVVDPASEDDNLERWQEFHEGVARLPAEEREVMQLVFYHGWTQAQIAELLQTSDRSVRRRWQSACLMLDKLVKGGLPEI